MTVPIDPTAVVDDGAQSFGAEYKGNKSCNVSTIGCNSFFPSKPLGCCGDGGAIFTNDDYIAAACHEIRVHGQSQRYVHTRVEVGGRMDTLQYGVMLAKLERFDWEVKQHKFVGHLYNEILASADIDLVTILPDHTCVYAQYTVFVPDRDAMQKRLSETSIPAAVHYPVPLNEQPAYKHLCCPDCTPIAQLIAKQVMNPDLSAGDQHNIVSALLA